MKSKRVNKILEKIKRAFFFSLVIYMTFAHARESMRGSININYNTPDLSTVGAGAVDYQRVPFDDELFSLAYTTYLANANVQSAYFLSEAAINRVPEDIKWRERAAQTALWSGRSGTALKHLAFISDRAKNPEMLKKTIQLAKQLRYEPTLIDTLKIWIAQNPNDQEAWLELAKAQDQLGKPDVALKILNEHPQLVNTKDGLLLKAVVYRNMGNNQESIRLYKAYEKKYGADAALSLEQARVFANLGDLNLAKASLLSSKNIAKKYDAEYWELFSDLSWQLNHRADALFGYSKIYNLNYFYLERYLILVNLTNPPRALQLAERGFSKYRRMIFLQYVFDLSTQLRQWGIFNNVVLSLKPKELRQVFKLPNFWINLSRIYADMGYLDMAEQVILKGMNFDSEMEGLKEAYIWLLIREGDRDKLKWAVDYFDRDENFYDDKTLWLPYAHAVILLDKPEYSLILYDNYLRLYPEDKQIGIFYAQAMDAARFYKSAYNLKLYLWYRYSLDLQRSNLRDYELWREIGQLTPYFASGDEQYRIYAGLVALDLDSTDADIMLTWAIFAPHYDVSKYLKAYYFSGILPNWAELNLAILDNDQLKMQKLLLEDAKKLPRVDRVTAAERTEQYPLAQTLSYEGLTEKPDDYLRYIQFTDLMMKDVNYIDLNPEYEKFSSVSGFHTNVFTKFRVTPLWSIGPYYKNWFVHSDNEQLVTNVPDNDTSGGVRIYRKIHKGVALLDVSIRSALNTFLTARLNTEYRYTSKLTSEFEAGYNQEDLDSVYTRIGGVQDEISAELNYNITMRDLLSAKLRGDNYYSQDRHYLGQGVHLRGVASHKFWFSYPDYTIDVFSEIHGYSRNGSYGGDITKLFPNTLVGEDAEDPTLIAEQNKNNYAQIIPNSFSEWGMNFNFGRFLRTDYNHTWRPYLSVSVFYSTLVGLSNNVEAGLTGSVFGRDKLLFYAERGTALTAQNQVDYTIGISYKIFS